MSQRAITYGLLWLAMAALLALFGLLLGLRGSGGAAVDAALALNMLLLPLPVLGLLALRRRAPTAAAEPAPQAGSDARARFLAEISHEIRTPMNAIMGMTQLALQTPLTPEQRDLLTKADAASRTLLGLVNDVLEVSRIEAGRVELQSLPLRLEDVVAQAVERIRPVHANPAVALICDWADASLLGARGQLRGDAERLQQVLVHLLAHAVRATPAGAVVLRLAAGATQSDGRVPLHLTVQDGGAEASGEHLASLLAGPAAGAPAPRRYAGTGLGLAVTRRLVELMGGRLVASHEAGRGSRLEIELALPLDGTALPPPPVRPRPLLLAEARPDSREATAALLRHLGLGEGLVAAADTPATLAALDEARRAGRAFDWLLLDWQLPGPGPTGAELLARLRRDHPALRIAVLSPPGPGDSLAAVRAFGARAQCPKPLLPGELRRLLEGGPAGSPAAVDTQSLSGLRVLLVEDHPVNQEIALRLLSSRGAQVDIAHDGQQGLDRLQALGPEAYDLVLMDLQMPVLDGLSATRRLRALPGFQTLPVLAMTAYAMAEERAECLAAGMQGHIAKPLDVARLVLELQHYRRAALPPPPAPLDLAAGLRQFGGQALLYRRTLQGFADQYAAGLAAWTTWLAAGEWAELRRAAHTLQGLAATLGAQPLHRLALALEHSAATQDGGSAAGQLARVDAALTAVLDDIREALAAGGTPPAARHEPGDLAELHELVRQSDSRALDWWQAHGALSGLDAITRQRLEAALAALDFDAAALALGSRAG